MISSETKRILVVDDEEDIRDTIRCCFDGYEVDEADYGLKALERIAANRPDVIISDYNMPKFNGLEFMKVLIEKEINIPVIWITGRGSPELHREAWAHGVYEYIEKPFPLNDLRDAVMGALKFQVDYSKITSDRVLSRSLYDKVLLMLNKGTLREFEEYCYRNGVSPSTGLTQLMTNFMQLKNKAS